MKNGKRQNVVATSSKQNLAAAKACETYNEAVNLFRALEHANNRGTTEWTFDHIEEHFINEQGSMNYLKHGLK